MKKKGQSLGRGIGPFTSPWLSINLANLFEIVASTPQAQPTRRPTGSRMLAQEPVHMAFSRIYKD